MFHNFLTFQGVATISWVNPLTNIDTVYVYIYIYIPRYDVRI